VTTRTAPRTAWSTVAAIPSQVAIALSVAEVWDVAESFCLCPPIGGLPPEEVTFDLGGIAETFYS
jgi:hypothetical protein